MNIGTGGIPASPLSLLIAEGVVANEEPAVLVIFPESAHFDFEWKSALQRRLSLAAQSFQVVRMEHSFAKVRTEHIFASLDFHSAGKRLTLYGARLRTAPMWGSPAPFALVTSSTDPTRFALPA